MRTMASSELNMTEANVLASSVFPVPDGPTRRNDAIGRFWFPSPDLLRRIAFETAVTA